MQKLDTIISGMPPIVRSIKKQKKEQIDSKNLLVFQHNELIRAKYSLTLHEKRIILWLMSKISPDDADFKLHTLPVKEFMNIVGINGQGEYTYLKKITFGLVQKGLRIINEDTGTETQLTWVSCAEYNKGMVNLSFHPKMKPLLIYLKSKFTVTSLNILFQFKSTHSIRIYELLKQYENIGNILISIDEIKSCCGLDNKLKKHSHFKTTLLHPALQEINAKSDIYIEYELKKISHKYTDIKFIISKNKLYHSQHKHDRIVNDINVQSISQSNLFSELMDFGLTKKMATKLLSENADEVIRNAIACVDIQIKKGYARNPKALLITAIKDKYNPNMYQAK